MRTGLRWTVSLEETLTSPSFENTFRRAILCASEQDVAHQRRFRFKQDALATLVGRLMARKAAVTQTSRPWSSLEFEQNKNGKPFLIPNENKDDDDDSDEASFNYNVSHHGDLVVLASGDTRIGVDVMRISEDRHSSVDEQMNMMKRHFSEEEVMQVTRNRDEKSRWTAFFRIWCLKESILKATGVGLPDGLHNHTFRVTEEVRPDLSTTSTRYFHHQIHQPQWLFEEAFIGQNHCVAVASEASTPSSEALPFKLITLEEILKDADFVNVDADADEELDVFMEKPNKTF
ncbi:unnamed protein product [Caenorhabditis sp. 36 PRJEB53466]|nr:unnamed protein product [Caenorhabditis sp. 36 PRJEB53466]